jgi:hypothetical protein
VYSAKLEVFTVLPKRRITHAGASLLLKDRKSRERSLPVGSAWETHEVLGFPLRKPRSRASCSKVMGKNEPCTCQSVYDGDEVIRKKRHTDSCDSKHFGPDTVAVPTP